MSDTEQKKHRLQAILTQTFKQPQTRSKSSTRSRHADELHRLQSICFPQKADASFSQSLNYSYIQIKNEYNNTSSLTHKSHIQQRHPSLLRNRFPDNENSSFIIPKTSDVSFDISPLSPKDVNRSTIIDNPFGMRKTVSQEVEHGRETLSALTNHFSEEMKRFVSVLTNSMRTVCLTKMSEKSIQLLLNSYLKRLDNVQAQWEKNLANGESFKLVTKNLVSILAGCFEDILRNLNELLMKLKIIKGIDFNPMGNEGVLQTLTAIIQQDHTLTAHQVLMEGIQVMSRYTSAFGAIRLAFVLNKKIMTRNSQAFNMIKLNSMRTDGSAMATGSYVLFNLLSSRYLKHKIVSFNTIRSYTIEKQLMQELYIQEELKNLMVSLLKASHSESRFFRVMSTFLSSLTSCRHCEFLSLDKQSFVAYGYSLGFMDESLLDTQSPIRLSYEKESLLKHVIETREAVYSWNLPHISLYNREIDVPLSHKDQENIDTLSNISGLDRFIYFPVCNTLQGTVGVVRLFLDPKETVDTYAIDKLSRFSETMGPLLGVFIRIQKLSSMKRKSPLRDIDQNTLGKLVHCGMDIVASKDSVTMLEALDHLLSSLFYIDSFSLFHYDKDSRLVELYTSKATQAPRSEKGTRSSLQIPLKTDDSQPPVGIMELGTYLVNPDTTISSPNDSKYIVDSIPPSIQTFLASYGLYAVDRLLNPPKGPSLEDLSSQLSETRNRNISLDRQLNLHQVLLETNRKLQTAASYADLVLVFNEAIHKAGISAELGGIFFANPDNSSYFTYNYLATPPSASDKDSCRSVPLFSEHLVSFSKKNCLLGSLLDSISSTKEILRINHHEPWTTRTSNSGRFTSRREEHSRALDLDLEKENVLVHLSTKLVTKKPETILILPVSLSNSTVKAYIVFGKCSTGNTLTEEEELFAGEVSDLFSNVLSNEHRLSESLGKIHADIEKSHQNSNKMKAYRSLLTQKALLPEYQVFKEHKNLQAFVSFIEAVYRQTLKAEAVKVLLYNEGSQNLYYYPKVGSQKIRGYKQRLDASITGGSVLKNQVFVYPPMECVVGEEEQKGFLQSHRLKTLADGSLFYSDWASQQQEAGYSRASSYRSQVSGGSNGGRNMFLDQWPGYNGVVDSYNENGKGGERAKTFLCVPLWGEEREILGVVQAFGKQKIGKVFGSKDVNKASAVTEAVIGKLVEIKGSGTGLVSRKVTRGLEMIEKAVQGGTRKIVEGCWRKLKEKGEEGKKREERVKKIVPLQGRLMVKIIEGVVKGRVLQEKKTIFEELRKLKGEKKSVEEGDRAQVLGIKECFMKMLENVEEVYEESVECRVGYVEIQREKGFWYNRKEVVEVVTGQEIKGVRRIIQNKVTRAYHTIPVWKGSEKAACIVYEWMAMEGEEKFSKDSYVLIEVLCKKDTQKSMSPERKESIRRIFASTVMGLRTPLRGLSNIQRKCWNNLLQKSLFQWRLSTNEARGSEVLCQTSRALESQIASVEREMEQCQKEIVDYSQRIKRMSQELDHAKSQNALLDQKLGQTTLEKKAKTKCLSASLLVNHLIYLSSHRIRARAALTIWKGLLKGVKQTRSEAPRGSVGGSRRHVLARYQAATVILAHLARKWAQKKVTLSFKRLVTSSVASPVLLKSSIRVPAYDFRYEKKYLTPEKVGSAQERQEGTRTEYMPLKRIVQERVQEGEQESYRVEERWSDSKIGKRYERSASQGNENRRSLEDSGFGRKGESRGVAKSTQRNDENEFFSGSPRHRSFIQYKGNLLESSLQSRKSVGASGNSDATKAVEMYLKKNGKLIK